MLRGGSSIDDRTYLSEKDEHLLHLRYHEGGGCIATALNGSKIRQA